jgi:indole-3-glycerol phosphate synthase
MMNILNDIILRTRERINEKKKVLPMKDIIRTAECYDITYDFPFEKALSGDDVSFICEIKKASPSKGIIVNDLDHLRTAEEYQTAGASAISVLTEPFYFRGDDRHLKDISDAVAVPLLRKDFIVDEYMIYEAKLLGADAVLLICAALDERSLSEYIKIAHGLGLSVLAETHDENEVTAALNAGARIIGVNNRDLRTFDVDISISERLRPLVPKDAIFVSESGIRTPGDVDRLRKAGVNAVLIGEALMRSPDKQKELRRLRGDAVG